jgi:threonine/homoserine efflux transporter RhtA
MLLGIAAASSLLANTPVVAASILLIKGYMVIAELVSEQALGPTFSAWPDATLPVFVAMMFGATLGGNATLIGAAANLAAVGVGLLSSALPWSLEQQGLFEAEAQASLDQQRAIEGADTMPFETFRQDYVSAKRLMPG